MVTTLVSGPSIEPITTTEAKEQLRLTSYTLSEELATVQSIAPGSHDVAASYSLIGSSVDVLGYNTLVLLEAGACGASGTVDVKIQESDSGSTWTDWSGGAFTQVTEANDNAQQEIEYTGEKQYVRVVATVATAACSFGVTVIKQSPYSQEDSLIGTYITTARRYIENYLRRKLISQTWKYFLQAWPSKDNFMLPYGSLQSVASITYKDSDGNSSTFGSSYYIVDTDSDPGKIVLAYGESWPTISALYPINPITIQFTCGYGDNRSDVPQDIRDSIKMLVGWMYEQRESSILGGTNMYQVIDNPIFDSLLGSYRIWSF